MLMKNVGRFRRIHRQHGQTLILFVFFLVVLIIFIGLGIDLGLAYITKAQLSKAVDAAALSGARNITSSQANAIAKAVFSLNYGRPSRDAGPVNPKIDIATDPTTKTRQIQVTATATINTFFLRILPMWKTLNVSATAQAIRSRIVLAIILDRSGSMQSNGGCSSLPGATDAFINLFDDNLDKAALVTFSTVANTIVTMRRPFRQAISNGVPRSCSMYSGSTYMQAGLTNGYVEIQSEPVAPGESVIRAAVFFTDGLPNIITETWACNGSTAARNIGGTDPPSTSYNFYNPITGSSMSGCSTLPTGYTSMTLIRAAAKSRTLALASQMRQSGILVYVIGLGDNLDKPFLCNLANVATPPATSPIPFPTEPSGIAVFPATAADVQNAFQTIASDILGRLTL
jgi:Flp pilus assembly protein TadG